ncbi:TonB-dependent receptor (plasmid) [Asticcacaulis sp. DW145]|uniref:TonB-dependent receptor n=1 Tax=Asticcacaulis sp. DW145 TaxID=3095608 RepID=UPI003093484F|nr:TonB-dependent receptor [Asticcacaulis sp. DW145]
MHHLSRYFACSVSSAALLLISTPVSAYAEVKTYSLDIPAQEMSAALRTFSRSTREQIVFDSKSVKGLRSNAVKGSYSAEQALQLLTSGSPVSISRNGAGVYVITKTGEREISATQPVATDDTVEVVVTGTHIRGGNPTSPVRAVTQKEIQQSGYSQVSDLIKSLPENFSGGQNPGVIAANSTNSENTNVSNAATINLRGLGTNATLVLVNGHRLSGDGYHQGSDITGVPMAAIQRIEIVSDGASAQYGSDAIAGVVNFILRKDFSGSQLSGRWGQAADGGGAEQTYNFLTGFATPDWHGLVSVEGSQQAEVTASDRDFTNLAAPATTLIPKQDRQSLYVDIGGNIANATTLEFDGIVKTRTAAYTQVFSGTPYTYTTETPSYSFAFTASTELFRDWKIRSVAGASASQNLQASKWPTGSSSIRYRNETEYFETSADGKLLTLPSGDVKAAFGFGYRNEQWVQNYPGMSSYIDASQKVWSAYFEVLAPLVTPSATRTGLREFQLSLSGRMEDYSSFGQTSTPKIGLRYSPFKGVILRATWGKSFKAPTFEQMYTETKLYLYRATTFGGPTGKTALYTAGGNVNLKPEKSTSWTMGLDYTPEAIRDLRVSATYFDIDYIDRIVRPISPTTTAINAVPLSPFVQLAPDSASQAALLAKGYLFTNFSGGLYDPTNVAAIVRQEFTNAASQRAKGLDLSYRQRFEIDGGDLSAFANATSIDLKQQTTIVTPIKELSGTIFYVPKFKARGGLNWDSRSLSATAIVNYVASETDTGVLPNVRVASFTTVDTSISYSLDSQNFFFKGTRVTLSASNLFNRAPPRALSPAKSYPGIYFDSTNASAMGRFVSLTITKAW